MKAPLLVAMALLLAIPASARSREWSPHASKRLANAIRLNDLKKALHLLDHGANVDTQAEDGRTVLMLAASRGDIPSLKKVKARNPEIDLQDNQGRTALIHSAAKTEAMLFLIEVGADPTIKDRRGADISHHFGRVCAIREQAIKKGLGGDPVRLPLMLQFDAPPLLPVPPELQQLQ